MLSSQQKGQRIGVFVDVQNMYYSARFAYDQRVNFKALLKEAVAGRSLIRAIAYVIQTEDMKNEPFFEALEKIGFDVRSKDLQIFAGGAKKGDWDVGIAMDAVVLAPKLDTIVLVSGDGDFEPLVQYLQWSMGCRVEVISWGKSTSSKLIEAADQFTDLDNDHKKYLLGKRRQTK